MMKRYDLARLGLRQASGSSYQAAAAQSGGSTVCRGRANGGLRLDVGDGQAGPHQLSRGSGLKAHALSLPLNLSFSNMSRKGPLTNPTHRIYGRQWGKKKKRFLEIQSTVVAKIFVEKPFMHK